MTGHIRRNPDFKRDLTALLPQLFRYARSLSDSISDAEDLLQATCERALSREVQFTSSHGDSSLIRWTFTIMTSINKNRLRNSARRSFHSAIDADLMASSADPERDLYLRQILQQVESLPAVQRQVMLLVYVEGFSYQDAASIMEVPVGTVMSRIARARAKLAEFRATVSGTPTSAAN